MNACSWEMESETAPPAVSKWRAARRNAMRCDDARGRGCICIPGQADDDAMVACCAASHTNTGIKGQQAAAIA